MKGNKTMTPHKKAPMPRPSVDKGFKGKAPEKGFGKAEKKPFGKK